LPTMIMVWNMKISLESRYPPNCGGENKIKCILLHFDDLLTYRHKSALLGSW
jgi:hypothetical protein